MKTEELLNDLDTKLFNIHAMLFSGNLNKEELQSIKEELSDYLNDDVMRELNYLVDEEKYQPKEVASNFLKQHNLISI